MKKDSCLALLILLTAITTTAQIGKRFPSERKVIKDPVTGTMLTFLTSTAAGDSKIYQTHNQWTSDGEWLIFRSNRVRGEAMAVHEKTGDIVQVTEGGYTGMLNVARKSMKLYFFRNPNTQLRNDDSARRQAPTIMQVVEVDLAKLFADSKAGTLQPASVYQRVCGTTPPSLGAGGDMALDGDEEWVYFRVGKEEAARGPSGTREKPTGLAIVNLRTCEMLIAGQTKSGSGLWHVSGSADGRWAVGDDFARNNFRTNG